MKKIRIKSSLFFLLVLRSIVSTGAQAAPPLDSLEACFHEAQQQLNTLLTKANEIDSLFPRTIDNKGEVVFTNQYEWTSGFFPGSLWYAYEGTRDESLRKEAIKWTEKLQGLKDFKEHHDLGFMVYCSYGNAYRLTKDEKYKDILVQAAHSLSTRFCEKTGVIKSWNAFGSWRGKEKYTFPVIIDNMMNLELLFFASKVTGDTRYRDMAIRHAENTLKNQIRKDYSCFHVVCYDPKNGQVLTQETAQGYADNSTWARGQAWAIYGFTMTYRETKYPRFLEAARKMADYYIDHPNLPADKITFWDFNAYQRGYTPSKRSNANHVRTNYRDASAAAVVASALFELATFTGQHEKKYRTAAIQILESLSNPAYFASHGTNGGFLLKHSVGSIPHGVEIDVPLVYADYYYLEALNRYIQSPTP
ncbi:glycoside hydrolase family 88 protein [Sphingobacterium chuzhouense]|uniref:glycoside hydrolase family 88 protein n=1 Tax=Sphingobacterium chuzhouense TaxID=1742264 RepID=UPI00293BC29A|nr:glycoside hydrolase family 88 protein [Sphingobacterium chuzhouense]